MTRRSPGRRTVSSRALASLCSSRRGRPFSDADCPCSRPSACPPLAVVRHQRIHTNTRPYPCKSCHERFTRSYVSHLSCVCSPCSVLPCLSCAGRWWLNLTLTDPPSSAPSTFYRTSDLVTRHRIKFHPSEELRPQAGIDSAVLPKNKKGRMTLSSPEHEREDVSGLRGGPNKDMMTCCLSHSLARPSQPAGPHPQLKTP